MAQKKRKGKRRGKADWAEAKRRCRLSVEDVQKAKELGFQPKSLIKNIPSPTEQWKVPVRQWIRELYDHKFSDKNKQPSSRRSTAQAENIASDTPSPGGAGSLRDDRFTRPPEKQVGWETMDATDAHRPVTDRSRESAALPENDAFELFADEKEAFGDDWDEEDEWSREWGWQDEGVPTERDIEQQNEDLLRRQREFRLAAEFACRAFSEFPSVQKVVLIGSVAQPLKKEIPRFREYRRAGIAVYHECHDVDLAVWLDDLSILRALGKARSRAMNELFAEHNVGVAHHQVEVFVMQPGTDKYLGRLCTFNKCPKQKRECRVPGCGDVAFLQQHEDFVFKAEALAPQKSELLFERNAPDDVPF